MDSWKIWMDFSKVFAQKEWRMKSTRHLHAFKFQLFIGRFLESTDNGIFPMVFDSTLDLTHLNSTQYHMNHSADNKFKFRLELNFKLLPHS